LLSSRSPSRLCADHLRSNSSSWLTNTVHWIDLFFMHYNFPQIRRVSLNKICAILCHSKNRKEIYYQYEDVGALMVDDTPDGPLSPTHVPITATPIAAATVPQSALKTSLFQQLLVGGKSTVQKGISNKSSLLRQKKEELPLEQLGSALGIQQAWCLDLSAARCLSYLAKTWGLGVMHGNSTLASRTSGSGSSGGKINSKEFLQFQADQNKFTTQSIPALSRSRFPCWRTCV
jgi:hypothetical protein